jgi:mannitol/fructose-specific phosphotransferase system IIA component (Ntr-type)
MMAAGSRPSLKVHSKKHALQELSDRAGLISGLAPREIFDVLLQRERLGSTGIGEGIAIPHGKLASPQAPSRRLLTMPDRSSSAFNSATEPSSA